MLERARVACVPGSSFFEDPRRGSQLVRFCFCKKYETLEEAGRGLLRLKS
jgi:aminotransferase